MASETAQVSRADGRFLGSMLIRLVMTFTDAIERPSHLVMSFNKAGKDPAQPWNHTPVSPSHGEGKLQEQGCPVSQRQSPWTPPGLGRTHIVQPVFAPNALLMDFFSPASTNAFPKQLCLALLHALPAFLWENHLVYLFPPIWDGLCVRDRAALSTSTSPVRHSQAGGTAHVSSLKSRNPSGVSLALPNAAGMGL